MRRGIFLSTFWRRKLRLGGVTDLPNSYTVGIETHLQHLALSTVHPPIIHCTFSNKAVKAWAQSYVCGKKELYFQKAMSNRDETKGVSRLCCPGASYGLISSRARSSEPLNVWQHRQRWPSGTSYPIGYCCFWILEKFWSSSIQCCHDPHHWKTSNRWVPTQLWHIPQEQGLKEFHWQPILMLNLSWQEVFWCLQHDDTKHRWPWVPTLQHFMFPKRTPKY